MPKLLISETQEIFNLFKKRLDKIEALYLFGYYYAKCSTYVEDDITKNIIIAQQFLTYLQRNSYSSLDKDDFVKDRFYDDNDDIDDNCHPDFQVPDQEDIDIAKIQNNIPFFNDMLEIPLVFDIPQIETKIEKPEEENFEDEKDVQERWYKAMAKEHITKRMSFLSNALNMPYNQLFIRTQNTKWGNCTSDKNISINWKLIKCPEYVIDYVCNHELCHTKIMNHGVQFKSLLKSLCPDDEKAQKRLVEYGSGL